MRADSNLKDTMELFKEKRRQQDNDLFYYLNTIVEVNSILFELSNSLEDARQKHQNESISRIEQELSSWRQEYQEYFDECQRILQDLRVSELSSYDEVENIQKSQEWKDVVFLLSLLTRYHDLLKEAVPSLDTQKTLQEIADAINARYDKVFKNKSLNEYNVNLFGEPKKLIADVSFAPKEEDSLFEEVPVDDYSFDFFEHAEEPKKVEEPRELIDENEILIQNLIKGTLPHILDEEQENWILFLKDVSHHEYVRQLITFMEKLEKGYQLKQLYEDVKNYSNGEELLNGIMKYSKAYQRQVEELIKQAEKEGVEEDLPLQNRNRSNVVSELFFYIRLYDKQNSKKTNLARVVEMSHIELDDLSSLDFSRDIHPVENEEILDRIYNLLEEYQDLIEQPIDIVSVCDLISGKSLDSSNVKKFFWVRKVQNLLSRSITKNKKSFYTLALAKFKSVVSGVSESRIEEDVQPLVFEHVNVPVELSDKEVTTKSSPVFLGDFVCLKEDALVYRKESLGQGGMQGEIPSYSLNYARKVEGLGILLADGTVRLVFDEETARKFIEEGNQIESILVFDGFYSICDAVLVDNYEKGRSL